MKRSASLFILMVVFFIISGVPVVFAGGKNPLPPNEELREVPDRPPIEPEKAKKIEKDKELPPVPEDQMKASQAYIVEQGIMAEEESM